MSNPGASPVDATTNVGLLRVLVGDTASVPLVPPVSGQADYAVWSDNALLGALLLANDSTYRAAGDLYTALAAEYAQIGGSIKTDDLALSSANRSGDLLKIARSFYARADAEDASASEDFFEIASPNFLDCDSPWGPGEEPGGYIPDPAPAPSGYGY